MITQGGETERRQLSTKILPINRQRYGHGRMKMIVWLERKRSRVEAEGWVDTRSLGIF